ncbi:uncharacterized protein K489DRAFT_205149 [Dissoconium aciculare CBS 342.82]|uniref:Uncharacterized protein n=1 Tax=Dissoconium aciculare CBS 342.82 TaxID=1314786 RepID=A0A6J3M7Z7_9PEZI|nr:uncharacterized protein K489DRAFT_205149 [Dissoconium aciculare CBS 342.82]KAF1823704.1 hypothetical protein K489DRAFT_205149 [Dissoconium aciculare CBS 342.82]
MRSYQYTHPHPHTHPPCFFFVLCILPINFCLGPNNFPLFSSLHICEPFLPSIGLSRLPGFEVFQPVEYNYQLLSLTRTSAASPRGFHVPQRHTRAPTQRQTPHTKFTSGPFCPRLNIVGPARSQSHSLV